MSYADALVATLCCGLFALAAFLVGHRLRSVTATSPRAVQRPREEDLVRPTLDQSGQTVWATQDELPWPDLSTLAPSATLHTPAGDADTGEVAS